MHEQSDSRRHQSSRGPDTLAKKITLKHDWDDLKVPPQQLQELRKILGLLKSQDAASKEAQSGDDRPPGKGISILFAGPSGTGKTMAADVIAGAISLDLYQFDLSSLVNKQKTESEQTISQIFQAAEASTDILLLTEADALLDRRTSVHDAHDRYANLETNYLLQRLEAYEGIVIITTNLAANRYSALQHRIQFMVEFSFAESEDSQDTDSSDQ